MENSAIAKEITAALKEQKNIHGYTCKKFFGDGGQGSVFLAEKDDTKDLFAIKVVPPDFTPWSENPEKVKQAEESYAKNEKVDSKYLIKYVDHFRENINALSGPVNCTFLVMELCSGGDLGDLIKSLKEKKQKINYNEFMRLFAQSSIGMYILRKNRILHRDLKPENIFLDKDNNTKIADFGCAKQLSLSMDLTPTGTVGTPGWVAPEIGYQLYGYAADVFSFGLVFFYLAKLELPLSKLSLPSEAKRLREANPDIPQSVADLLVSMLNQNPDLRPTITKIVRHPEVKKAIEALPDDRLPADLVEEMNSTDERSDSPAPTDASSSSPSSSPPSAAAGPPPEPEPPIFGVPQSPPASPKPAGVLSENEVRFRGLSDTEFQSIFNTTRAKFAKNPLYKQNDLKKQKGFA